MIFLHRNSLDSLLLRRGSILWHELNPLYDLVFDLGDQFVHHKLFIFIILYQGLTDLAQDELFRYFRSLWAFKVLIKVLRKFKHLNQVASVSFTRHQESYVTEIKLSIVDAILVLGKFVSEPLIIRGCCKFVWLSAEKGYWNAREGWEIERWWLFLSILNLIHFRAVIVFSELFAYNILTEMVHAFERGSSRGMSHPLLNCSLTNFESCHF